MLQESVYTTDVECLDLSAGSENGSTPASGCGVDIIDEMLVTSDACNASSSESPRDEQNVNEMIECFEQPSPSSQEHQHM